MRVYFETESESKLKNYQIKVQVAEYEWKKLSYLQSQSNVSVRTMKSKAIF